MLTILTLLAPFEYTSDIRILLCILMNILFLLLLCIMVYMGIARKISSIVNTAIIFFGIYLFGKYLAFVFESKMDGAIVFLSGGVIVLLITGLTEAIRRRILRNVTSS